MILAVSVKLTYDFPTRLPVKILWFHHVFSNVTCSSAFFSWGGGGGIGLKKTVKSRFNVPTFSEIPDLVMIFSCPDKSSI
jgi:hypothetical protein